jgi:VanZ family protein
VLKKPFVIAAAAVAAVIVYGSLYPFQFRHPAGDAGALVALLGTWNARPGRGDFLANVFLYMPLGFFALLALRERGDWLWHIVRTVLVALAICVPVELTQHYLPGRVTSLTDVYANALGAALGGLGALAFGTEFRWPLLREMRAQPIPVLLLVAWLGFRLYPYVPTIDLHKYWDALKPVLHGPPVASFALFQDTVMWLAVCALIDAIAARRFWLLFPLFAGGVLFARVLILTTMLSAPEVFGAALAYAIWLPLRAARPQQRAAVAALLLLALVSALRLDPFRFHAAAGDFGWIPFRSAILGAPGIDLRVFLQKFFYYGGLIWFLAQAGLRMRSATILVAALLFLTGIAEIYLPGHAAGITDAVMALIVGGIFALIARPAAMRFDAPSARRA